MSRIEKIEDQIKGLSLQELALLREWFIEFDAKAWDEQFDADVRSGKLEKLADRALRDHATGRSTEL